MKHLLKKWLPTMGVLTLLVSYIYLVTYALLPWTVIYVPIIGMIGVFYSQIRHKRNLQDFWLGFIAQWGLIYVTLGMLEQPFLWQWQINLFCLALGLLGLILSLDSIASMRSKKSFFSPAGKKYLRILVILGIIVPVSYFSAVLLLL